MYVIVCAGFEYLSLRKLLTFNKIFASLSITGKTTFFYLIILFESLDAVDLI